MERHMTHFVQFSYFMMIPTVFTASKGLEIFYSDIYCEYFRPLFINQQQSFSLTF